MKKEFVDSEIELVYLDYIDTLLTSVTIDAGGGQNNNNTGDTPGGSDW